MPILRAGPARLATDRDDAMPHASLAIAWQRLPLWLRIRLAHGSVGSVHRLRCAADAIARSQSPSASPDARVEKDTLLRTGRELLLAAWEDDPCNGQLAGQALLLHQRMPWLHPALAVLLDAVQGAWRRPADLARYERLAAQADWVRLQRHVDAEREGDPDNLFWVQQAVAVGELAGDLDWLADHLARAEARLAPPSGNASPIAPLFAHLSGCLEANRAAGADESTAASRHAAALARFRTAAHAVSGMPHGDVTPGPGCWLAPLEHAAHCLARLGDVVAALPLWDAVLAARPWHANLALRAHDAWRGADAPEAAPAGSTAVLLYSWNKAAELDTALTHLAPSLPDMARIALLDNGSTDGTGDVVRAWADRFGADRCTAVHLPVNVGAAAARNWLMRLPEVAVCDFAAYLDDDAAVPPDWLRRLAGAVRRQPDASAWGGRTLDWHAPYVVQSADLHLTAHFRAPEGTPADLAPFADDTPPTPDGETGHPRPDALSPDVAFSPARAHALPFSVSDLHAQVTDMGRFDYLRPCISVTGCCHLFRTAELLAAGGFALPLSPSQYDDLEHDLRQARAGRMACYTGFLPVRHMKRSGKAVRLGAAQFGNGLGNRYKLSGMFDAAEILAMRRREFEALERDLLRKLAALSARTGS
ncbi:glycosyltransferase [Nitratidesulfovibrio sp. HK-II]|uniref:glycosyltransferase n=1 Tax=Nitratidesulfovibrio sp. HK-II TaxID=2009266 RepID=UPI001E5C10D4|nr:glycosyltransferase [Nitratidesulfovibrio sp. HK-II]